MRSSSFTCWIFNSLFLITDSVCYFSSSVVFRATTGVDGEIFGTPVWGTVGANKNPEPNKGSNSMVFAFQPLNFIVVDDNVELSSSWFQLITIALVSKC